MSGRKSVHKFALPSTTVNYYYINLQAKLEKKPSASSEKICLFV